MHKQFYKLQQLPKEHQDINALIKNNSLLLPNILLAGRRICRDLKIQKYGYRMICSRQKQNKQVLALIVYSSLFNEYTHLGAPLNIIQKTSSTVLIKRISLGVANYVKPHKQIKNSEKEIENIDELIQYRKNRIYYLSIFPKLSTAIQLCIYLNEKSEFGPYLSRYFGENMFILPTKAQQFIFDISWLQQSSIDKESYQFSSMLYSTLATNSKSKFRCYLKVRIKGILAQGDDPHQFQYCLFQPTKTKIFIQKASQYQLNNIITKIQLPYIYQEIFDNFQPFIQLKKRLILHIQEKPEKKFILLKSGKHLGISSFLHSIAQNCEYFFKKINCESFVSEKQLYNQVKKCQDYGSTLIFIKNIDWLLQIDLKTDKSQVMKHIMRKLQQTLEKMGDKCFQSFILIVNFQGSSIKFDMTKNACLQVLNLTKQEKIQILERVCKYHQYRSKDCIILESANQVCSLLSNSLGWKKFEQILKSLSKKQSNQIALQTDDVIKQVSKFIEVQKVENIKNVGWDDVGGLKDAKQQIVQTILLPTKHPQLFDQWIKPRTGILFYGPPGTGKTMLGKCIANECKMGFISVKGPELLNMYIGESEKNVREVFERASANKPCIIFMDQLDALIPKRGQSSDSNQVMDRIVSQLLSQMDKAAGNGIFVIGATNRPDLLDPSILRPGRFDKQIYLGIMNDQNSRMQILKAQTRNLYLKEDFNFQKILENVPLNFTGADFYGLTSRSILKAAQRFIDRYEEGLQPKEGKVILIEQDFLESVGDMKPSVSPEQLMHYQKLREQYK